MKLPIPFLSKTNTQEEQEEEEHIENTTSSLPSLWPPWPYYCHRPRTLSFRTTTDTSHLFKTINTTYSVYNDDHHDDSSATEPPPESDEEEEECDSSVVEMAVRGLRCSERLFFEPGATSSILEESKREFESPLIKESLVMSMESKDPYVDFKKSMEEMVNAYGLKEWDDLKGLLEWYLRVNGKANHGHILGAFVDLMVNVQAIESTTTNHHHNGYYNSSPISSSSCSTSASSSSSSNSLSTQSVSVFESASKSGEIFIHRS